MNRVIKFRAWSKKGQYMEQVRGYWWEEEGCNSENLEDGFRYDDYVLMQYTGLKDKNAKEVYEGDIVKFRAINPCSGKASYEEIILVTWEDYNCGFNVFSDKFIDWEIIGNIYENPELLKA